MTNRQWQEMKSHADWHMAEAENRSYELGWPFKNRAGQMQCNEPKGLVGLALREWREVKGVAYTV